MIYSFHIFDKMCEQVYVKVLHASSSSSSLAGADHAKLLFGVVFSLYSLSQKLSPSDERRLSYTTRDYRVDTLRTLSGLLFVVVSSVSSSTGGGGAERNGLLETVYANLYVPYVVCNPLGSAALYPDLLSGTATEGKEGKKERKRRELLQKREMELGYGGRDHVRGLRMVQGNVLFDAALTQFLTGL